MSGFSIFTPVEIFRIAIARSRPPHRPLIPTEASSQSPTDARSTGKYDTIFGLPIRSSRQTAANKFFPGSAADFFAHATMRSDGRRH